MFDYQRLGLEGVWAALCELREQEMNKAGDGGEIQETPGFGSHELMVMFFLVFRYSVVKRADNEQLLLVATERINSLTSLLKTNLESLATFAGRSSFIVQNMMFSNLA